MVWITFSTNGQKDCREVKVKVFTELPIEESLIPFSFNAGDQYSAYLLAKYLQDQLEKAIENAHQLAYEQGWKDGKSKKRKKTYFRNSFTKGDPAC